jgi:signal transduction histidine kinase
MNPNPLFLFVYWSYINSSILWLLLACVAGIVFFWFRWRYVVELKLRNHTRQVHSQSDDVMKDYLTHLKHTFAKDPERGVQMSKLFVELYAKSPDAISFIRVEDQGRKLRIIEMNPAALELSGLSQERIDEGIETKDIMPDQQYRHFVQDILPAVLEGNTVTYVEEWNEGKEYWEVTVRPLKDQVLTVTHLAVFSRNKTAANQQKRLSAIMQSVIDNRPMEFCACDSKGTVIFQNLMSRQKFGDLTGKKLKMIKFSSNVEVQSPEITSRLLNGEHIIFDGEEMVSGEKRWFSYRLLPIVSDRKVCGYSYAAVDITEMVQHEKELLRSAINSEEKERIRFSQELHDGLGPLISAAKLYTGLLIKPTKDVDIARVAKDINKLLEESTTAIKDISFKLSPHILRNHGVAEALRSYAEKVCHSCQTKISLNYDNIPRFDDLVETVIYRVICECINNTLRYADASVISIDLQVPDHVLTVNYSDDGKGFDIKKIMQERTGIGLLNIQSRLKSINSAFLMDSTSGQGFRLSIKVPL